MLYQTDRSASQTERRFRLGRPQGLLIRRLKDVRALFLHVRNPTPIILDRLGLITGPYKVALKSGLAFELRSAVGDRSGFYEVLIRGDYTGQGQKILPGDTVIDVGANIGCFTILAAKMVGPSGRVIAIEPEPHTYQQLLRNIELNGARNVVPHHLSLGGREGQVKFYTGGSALGSSLFRSSRHTDEHLVEMTTLESLMKLDRITACSYMKMDCEGGEYEILSSLSPQIAAKIDQVSIEIHGIPHHRPEEIHERLRDFGFRQISGQPGSSVSYYCR
jgi:FkbM family methyltransferase